MSLGTLYATQQIRSLPAKALAKYFNLDIKISDKDAAYEKNFPLNKIPAFIGPKGFTLTEVIAICLYCMYLPPIVTVPALCQSDEKHFFQFIIQLSLS